MRQGNQYEVIIVGGSYAGLAAGMALGRALRKVLIIDGGKPCNRQTPYSHNFLTNDGKTPAEIRSVAISQVLAYNTVNIVTGIVTSASAITNGFSATLDTGEIFEAKKMVFATGIKDLLPPIPGIEPSWGISVLHCPYCHGYEVRGQVTGVLGNGEKAYDLVSLISNWTKYLRLYTNGESNLSSKQLDKLHEHAINIVEDEIDHIQHKEGYIQQLVFKNGKMTLLDALYARVSFEQHCKLPQLMGCALTEEGYIKIDSTHRTTIPGIYACGDNTSAMRTVANAVSMGTTTGFMINRDLIEEAF